MCVCVCVCVCECGCAYAFVRVLFRGGIYQYRANQLTDENGLVAAGVFSSLCDFFFVSTYYSANQLTKENRQADQSLRA